MKYYVLTFHHIKSDGSYGPMWGTPIIFTSRLAALEYGRTQVDYTTSDFKVNEAAVKISG